MRPTFALHHLSDLSHVHGGVILEGHLDWVLLVDRGEVPEWVHTAAFCPEVRRHRLRLLLESTRAMVTEVGEAGLALRRRTLLLYEHGVANLVLCVILLIRILANRGERLLRYMLLSWVILTHLNIPIRITTPNRFGKVTWILVLALLS